MDTLQWASKVEKREKKGEDSAWMARVGAPARQNRRASIWEERTTIIYYFRVFRVFRGSNVFFVSIRVHSCPFVVQIFYYFRVFRAFRGLK